MSAPPLALGPDQPAPGDLAFRGGAWCGASPPGELSRDRVWVCSPRGDWFMASEGPGERLAAVIPCGHAYRLAAAGLTEADCERIRAQWDSSTGLSENRRRRLAALHEVAAARALNRARLLRCARRREPPPGSASEYGPPRDRWVAFRLPDGGGWYADGVDLDDGESRGWSWDLSGRPDLQVLAVGLSLRQLSEASLAAAEPDGRVRDTATARIRAHLAAAGLLLPWLGSTP